MPDNFTRRPSGAVGWAPCLDRFVLLILHRRSKSKALQHYCGNDQKYN